MKSLWLAELVELHEYEEKRERKIAELIKGNNIRTDL